MTGEAPSFHRLVSEVLSHPYYEELGRFFQKIFSSGNKYVAFVTRRCLCIGYLFTKLLQDDQCGVSSLRFLSDSALIDSGFSIGVRLLNGEAPEILLVDDSIAYGRATRSILEAFFERVTAGFQSVGGDSHSEDYLSPLQYIQSKVEVRVFASKAHQFVLPSFYHRGVKYEKVYDDVEWNEISNRLSELVNVGNIANTAFVLSAGSNHIPRGETNHGWMHIESSYRQLRQHVWFKLIHVDGRITAICSVRCVQSGIQNRYRYVPFVFLSAFDHDTLTQLETAIFDRIYRCGDSAMKDHCRAVRQLREHTTSRRRMEFLTMYLSHSSLYSFADDFRLEFTPEAFDVDKIAWNYHITGDTDGDMTGLLSKLCQKEYRRCLLSSEELYTWVRTFPTESLNMTELDFAPLDWDEQRQERVQRFLENELFCLGIHAEKLAHDCVVQLSSPGEATLDSLNDIRSDSLFGFVRSLQRELGRLDGMAYLLACILQMMDCGAMSVVISDEEGRTEQQIRICEQSLFLLPRRYASYLDMLKDLERYSSYSMESESGRIGDFVNLLEQLHGKTTANVQELYWLLQSMRDAAQTVENWDIRLGRHFVIDETTGLAQWDYVAEECQAKQREEYARLWAESQMTG